MRFDWWTLALQTVNFAVLVWLLHRFLYKPVLRAIDARRAELSTGLNGGALRVVTAMPLAEVVTNEWRDRLHRAVGQNVSIMFDVDEALVAGAELHFPQAILRFSWRSVLAAMQTEIESHGNAC